MCVLKNTYMNLTFAFRSKMLDVQSYSMKLADDKSNLAIFNIMPKGKSQNSHIKN